MVFSKTLAFIQWIWHKKVMSSSSYFGSASGGHPLVAETATDILKAQGNAVDACVAAALVSTLVEPMLGSLAGGGLLLHHGPRGTQFFDFFVNFPGLGRSNLKVDLTPVEVQFGRATQTFYIGDASVCPPGVLKGLVEVHQKLGRLPLKELVQPAISHAKQGVLIDATQAYVIEILYPIMVQSKKGEELFLRDGNLLAEGDLFVNPDFADYLLELPNSLGRDIYEGQVGQKLVEHLGPDTLLTKRDLHEYQMHCLPSLNFKYREHLVHTSPQPSLGGVMMTALLGAMEHHDLGRWSHGSPEHIKELAASMVEVENRKSQLMANAFTKGTTHISVTDPQGHCVSFSMSNGQGCGHFIPDTGIMLNNMLGEDDLFDPKTDAMRPGQRISSMMSPTLVIKKDESPFALGAGGSKRIRSSIMQVVSNLCDFNLPLADAINAPRINWDGEKFQMESGFSQDTTDVLEKIYGINIWPDRAFYFGGVHAAQVYGPAVGDPRRGGVGYPQDL